MDANELQAKVDEICADNKRLEEMLSLLNRHQRRVYRSELYRGTPVREAVVIAIRSGNRN